jgi:hypothetical protein
MRGHAFAINAAGHIDDGETFHRLFKGKTASQFTNMFK